METGAHILFFGQGHHFVEALPAVVFADWVALFVADMAVGCNENADRILSCEMSVFRS